MAFNRFRPRSHFVAPHSWANDPCGAVYIEELKEYIFCYQWNPGTTVGGNSAWGMARSSDMVTWRDCQPAIQNGSTYDKRGVFSGSIVSRTVQDKRVLFLYYTSVAALPIHWSLPYLKGCESQSVAVSMDYGASWHRYENNPLLSMPPKGENTTGWRDPFVSTWPTLSTLLGLDDATNYMMIASGERDHGPQLHLYQSDDLLEWKPLSTLLDVKHGSKISPTSNLCFGKNFECASFFSIGHHDYIILGVEEDTESKRHSTRYTIWMSGVLEMNEGKPTFVIKSHGILDHGVAYAPHVFRDVENRLIQLAWADETAKPHMVKSQGWAGCQTHPRELYEISNPLIPSQGDLWQVDERLNTMTTLGIRAAPQTLKLRTNHSSTSLKALHALRSTNYEVNAAFTNLSRKEKFTFNILQSPTSSEVTKIILDLAQHRITIDRSHSSLENFGTSAPDSGTFHLLPNEDLNLHFYVDQSIIEVYVNDRFALTSRVYPSLETSIGASYDLGEFAETDVMFEIWEGLKEAWPERTADGGVLVGSNPPLGTQKKTTIHGSLGKLGSEVIAT